jgi:hypothetical protein
MAPLEEPDGRTPAPIVAGCLVPYEQKPSFRHREAVRRVAAMRAQCRLHLAGHPAGRPPAGRSAARGHRERSIDPGLKPIKSL